MKLSNREKYLGLIVLLLAGFYLYEQTILGPERFEINQLSTDNQMLAVQVETNREIMAINEQVEQEVGTLDYSQDMETMLPISPSTAGVISYLNSCVRDRNLTLCFVNCSLPSSADAAPPTKSTTRMSANTINLQIGVTGDFENIISFLASVENAPRIYKISHSNIKLADGDGESPQNSEPDQPLSNPIAANADRRQVVLSLDFSTFYD